MTALGGNRFPAARAVCYSGRAMCKRASTIFTSLLLAVVLSACLDPVGFEWKKIDDRRAKASGLLRKARDEIDAKSWTSAVDLLEQVEELGEKTPTVYALLGRANLEADRVEGAVDAFGKGVKVAPDRVDLQRGLAEALLARGSTDEAAKAAETCLLLAPDDRDSHLLHSRILEGQMDLDRALEAARKASSLDPDNEAAKIRVRELEKRRSDDRPHWELAQRFAVKGLHDEAIAALRKAIELKPTLAYRIKLVEWLDAAKRPAEAAKVLDGLVVEGVLGEKFQALGRRLKAAGHAIPHEHVLARGAEDALVKALGFRRRPWTAGSKTRLVWRPVVPPRSYELRFKHFFRSDTAVVAFDMESRLVVRHLLQLRRDLVEDRVQVRSSSSTVSLVSLKNNYVARWKSDQHKDEIFTEFSKIKKDFGMHKGAELLFYLTPSGEQRNVLIDGNPLPKDMTFDMLPFPLPPLPAETLRLGGKVALTHGAAEGMVEGAFVGPGKTTGILLSWDQSGGRGDAPGNGEFRKLLVDPVNSAMLWHRMKARFVLRGRSVEVDGETTMVSDERAAELAAEIDGHPDLGILE